MGVRAVQIRRVTPSDDPELLRRCTVAAFEALDAATGDPPVAWDEHTLARYYDRVQHLVTHDSDGCWLAETADGVIAGTSWALRRDGLWALSMLAVRPEHQDRGIGRALLDRALAYSAGCDRGMILSSADPRAVRRYHAAGFAVYPTMWFTGRVRRSAIPAVRDVREGSAADFDLANRVDRQVRGAAHGPDHEPMVRWNRFIVMDTVAGQGYAYCRGGATVQLAATNPEIARALFWSALAGAGSEEDLTVTDFTGDQRWAVDVAMAAGLSVTARGFLCVRGMPPPHPYQPSGAYL